MFKTTDLQPYFEKLSAQNWTVLPVSESFAQDLLRSAKKRFENNEFQSAGLNPKDQSLLPNVEKSIRSDSSRWLDSLTKDLQDCEVVALQNLELLQKKLAEYFRIGLTHFECHYAVYQPGEAYTRHTDQKKLNNKRFFSIVIYLNEDWTNSDGGQLVGYGSKDEKVFEITPKMGQAVLFFSDIEHEVLEAHRPRWSLTGWYRTA